MYGGTSPILFYFVFMLSLILSYIFQNLSQRSIPLKRQHDDWTFLEPEPCSDAELSICEGERGPSLPQVSVALERDRTKAEYVLLIKPPVDGEHLLFIYTEI